MSEQPTRSWEQGFTLIELLVTVAIIAILAAVAISSFRSYVKKGYEATAAMYMRNWVPAQELYYQIFGHYADADEQLQTQIHILKVPPKNIPYNFSINSSSHATRTWWGTGQPLQSGLQYFYIDETGNLLSSSSGPPHP
jgi:type IV pilus assembly protein PilE